MNSSGPLVQVLLKAWDSHTAMPLSSLVAEVERVGAADSISALLVETHNVCSDGQGTTQVGYSGFHDAGHLVVDVGKLRDIILLTCLVERSRGIRM